tara:strand:+ start:804 stop:1340 length:537 start_codon:yes stop_codon:yes gene_type:complete
LEAKTQLKLKSGDFGLIRKVKLLAYVLLGVGYGVWLFFTPARPNLDSFSFLFGISREWNMYFYTLSGVFVLSGIIIYLKYLSIKTGDLLLITDKTINYKNTRFNISKLKSIVFEIKNVGLNGYGTRSLRVGGGNFLSFNYKGQNQRIEFYVENKKSEDSIRSFVKKLSTDFDEIVLKE